MNKEDEIIHVEMNEEDVQNLVNCYEKDIKYIKKLEQELDKYKNIIDELEKYLKEEYEYYDKKINAGYGYAMGEINRIRNKLKELKGE